MFYKVKCLHGHVYQKHVSDGAVSEPNVGRNKNRTANKTNNSPDHIACPDKCRVSFNPDSKLPTKSYYCLKYGINIKKIPDLTLLRSKFHGLRY